MRNLIWLAAAALMVATTAAYAADKQEIMDVDRAFSTMAGKHGIRAAFQHYLAVDAVKLDGQSHAKFGRERITRDMSTNPEEVLLVWEPQDGMIAASGDLAYTWGTYELIINRDGEMRKSYGKYTSVWVKRDGEWRAILDTGNSSPPPMETP